MSKNIQLIIGSTRDNRIADDVAAWLIEAVSDTGLVNLEVVDLKEVDLPFFTSPTPPSYAPDESEAGRAWAAKIGSADGYIFLTPEYNRSIPASLKNALDYLVAEWKEKPAGIVSYGWIDGGKSAAQHLRDVLDWLKLEVAETEIALKFEGELMNENGGLKDAKQAFAAHDNDVTTLVESLVKTPVAA